MTEFSLGPARHQAHTAQTAIKNGSQGCNSSTFDACHAELEYAILIVLLEMD